MNGVNCSLPYNDLLTGLKYIAKDEGIAKLWSGTQASLLLTINPAIQFSVYESIKRYLTQLYGKEKPSVFYFFFLGALSKLVSTCITYPLQLVQTKMRQGNKKEKNHEIGTVEMVIQILKENGLKGLYCGLETKLWQTVATAALMFMMYEKIARFVKFLLRTTAPAA
jgi:solute carrier family 25 (peroxisomal adenine nucleotide transporter), member 17